MARTFDVDVGFSLDLLHVDSDAPRGWLSMLDVVSTGLSSAELPSQIPMEEVVGSGVPRRAPTTHFYVGIVQDT
jgi:hypothetical protein